MNKSSRVSLALLAALLLAGPALAQTANPPGPDAGRADRRCTSAALSADASAPCPGDVLNDRPGEGVRAPASSTAGSVNTTAGTATQLSPGITGAASTGAMGNMGAGSTGTSMGTGVVSGSGSVSTPARR